MQAEALERMPRRPESEFEWEDLLVRVELMPRALRVALEPLDPGTAAVSRILSALASRESLVSNFLELAAEPAMPYSDLPARHPDAAAARHSGESRDPGPHASSSAVAPESIAPQPIVPQPDTLVHFLRLRQRNFAMLQRRGLEVWDWSAGIGAAGDASVYQVLAQLVEADVQALANLRHLVSEVGSAC